jgi:hypothetical protein
MSRPGNEPITKQPPAGPPATASDTPRKRPDSRGQNGIGNDVIVRADTGHHCG